MIVNWIVEKYMFEDYEQKLCDAIRDNGQKVLLFDDTDWHFDFQKVIRDKFDNNDCVIFYGSLQRGRQMLRDTSFVPGIFLTIENYECSKYYRYYGDRLVNSDYIIYPLGELMRDKIKSHIFDYIPTDKIFIRPLNGYKTFTGQLLSKYNWDKELDVLCQSYGGIELETLVLIAKEQKVREENRFIVVSENGTNRIIDGSIYMKDGIQVKENQRDKLARIYAESVIDLYTPDPMFTLDIAKMDNGEYKVLEIGSFCCAGWYNVDIDTVVRETNKQVINEYNDFYNIQP